jgi:predicted 3-demethylubiquinone-9 3-methyltransferase (glyoxalase superfamily)
MAYTNLTTFLWFDGHAQEAAEFYVGLFPDARLGATSYYPDDAPRMAGEVLVVEFELFGQPFGILNAGPGFPHSEAVSFQIACDTQDDVDRLWDALTADGGEPGRCGWCKDRFGVSWQVTPRALGELLSDPDHDVSGYAMNQMMQMTKIVIDDLRREI